MSGCARCFCSPIQITALETIFKRGFSETSVTSWMAFKELLDVYSWFQEDICRCEGEALRSCNVFLLKSLVFHCHMFSLNLYGDIDLGSPDMSYNEGQS